MSEIISKNDVNYIAKLSKLEFKDDEIEKLTTEMNKILDYVNKLGELDTEDIEPTSHALSIVNAMRDDNIGESLTSEEALKNAPKSLNGHFEVPRVIEG